MYITLTLHTAAARLISLPIAAAPHHTLHTAQHSRSLLTAGAGAGCCCWLLLVGVGWCWLVLLLCWKAGGSSRTALCPGQHSTEPHTATAGVASTATTPNNTQQQHSTTLQQQPGPSLPRHRCTGVAPRVVCPPLAGAGTGHP